MPTNGFLKSATIRQFQITDIYHKVPTSVEGIVVAFAEMGHMELDAQPIEFTYRGRTQTYRPMSQPSHLWKKLILTHEGNDVPSSKIMIR